MLQCQRLPGAQDQDAEQVLVVHHVIEREKSELPRCREELKEVSRRAVFGVAVPRAVRIAEANPRFEGLQNWGLEATFDVECDGPLVERAPAAKLQRRPENQVSCAQRRPCGMKEMTSDCPHPNWIHVCL